VTDEVNQSIQPEKHEHVDLPLEYWQVHLFVILLGFIAAHLWEKSLIAEEQPYGGKHGSRTLRARLHLKGANVQGAV